jgi:hypothetical protein
MLLLPPGRVVSTGRNPPRFGGAQAAGRRTRTGHPLILSDGASHRS